MRFAQHLPPLTRALVELIVLKTVLESSKKMREGISSKCPKMLLTLVKTAVKIKCFVVLKAPDNIAIIQGVSKKRNLFDL